MREEEVIITRAGAKRRFLQSGSGHIGKVLEHVKVVLRTKPNVVPVMKGYVVAKQLVSQQKGLWVRRDKYMAFLRCKAAGGAK